MNKSRTGLRVLLASAFVVLVIVYLHRSEPSNNTGISAVFDERGVLILSGAEKTKTCRIEDKDGKIVAEFSPHGKSRMEVRLHTSTEQPYFLFPDNLAPLKAVTPTEYPLAAIRLRAPLGSSTHTVYVYENTQKTEDIFIPCSPGETIDLMIEGEALKDVNNLPLSFQSTDSNRLAEFTLPDLTTSLTFEFDNVWRTGRATIGKTIPDQPIHIIANLGKAAVTFRCRFVLRNADHESLSFVSWKMPVDQSGGRSTNREQNTIVMPDSALTRIARFFHLQRTVYNFYEPFSFQNLQLKNTGASPMHLLLHSTVSLPNNPEPLQWFSPPKFDKGGGTEDVIAFARIQPGETASCILPIYISEQTPAGNYTRRITVKAAGSDRILLSEQAPLGVVRSRPAFTLWTLVVLTVSGLWAVLLLFFFNTIAKRFGVRTIVLLSLLGAMQFSLSFAGGMVSNLFYALLGPFNCLVGGLLTEVSTYILMTAVLFLVPRTGAITISALIAYIMGGIMFGSFGIVDLLFVGSAAAFKELLLLLFGVTSIKAKDNAPSVLRILAALSLADALSAFTSITLNAIFYRLYFAEWYIFLQVVVTGFCYTAIGVLLGSSLGKDLRKVHL